MLVYSKLYYIYRKRSYQLTNLIIYTSVYCLTNHQIYDFKEFKVISFRLLQTSLESVTVFFFHCWILEIMLQRLLITFNKHIRHILCPRGESRNWSTRSKRTMAVGREDEKGKERQRLSRGCPKSCFHLEAFAASVNGRERRKEKLENFSHRKSFYCLMPMFHFMKSHSSKYRRLSHEKTFRKMVKAGSSGIEAKGTCPCMNFLPFSTSTWRHETNKTVIA